MGLKIELKTKIGIKEIDIGGEGFLGKAKFKEILGIVKEMEEREFDPYRKMWSAPLTKENFKKLELVCTEKQIEEIKELII